jgi:HSP20 family protein
VQTKEDKDKEGRVVRRERMFNSFRRAFTLPEDVCDEGIVASLDKGVLTVAVPKRPETEKPAPKRITVAAGAE